jgi:hypothetical protein
MQAAVLEQSASIAGLNADRLRATVLTRIAGAGAALRKSEVADDICPFVSHRLAPARWREFLDREIDALVAAGLVALHGAEVQATAAGVARAAIFLGMKGSLPRSWDHLLSVRLVATALGLQREGARRLAQLATPKGLCAAIVQAAFALKIKGAATPARLRAGLAGVALARAFGNQFRGGNPEKLGISAKAGRLLAAQLSSKPRDFGTDSRLVAALAAEQLGITQTGFAGLRLALLRRYLDGADKPVALPLRVGAKGVAARPRLVESPRAPSLPVAGRPDLAGFAAEVMRQAGARAQGWPGNRKAYISHVWQRVRETRPEWGISEIEFKCMLAEAHRAGSLALANADLKDNGSIKDLQDSALVYKNAVFHFIRADG